MFESRPHLPADVFQDFHIAGVRAVAVKAGDFQKESWRILWNTVEYCGILWNNVEYCRIL